jgi:hypothetical protein
LPFADPVFPTGWLDAAQPAKLKIFYKTPEIRDDTIEASKGGNAHE